MRVQDLADIVIGRDGRLSGPDMVAGLTAGLRKAGRNVIDIGMVPTPVVYFGAFHLRTGCCVSVTGSHNPPDYNGFKIVVSGETSVTPSPTCTRASPKARTPPAPAAGERDWRRLRVTANDVRIGR